MRPTKGTQVRMAGGKFSVTDGPFAETKELIDGFALVAALEQWPESGVPDNPAR